MDYDADQVRRMHLRALLEDDELVDKVMPQTGAQGAGANTSAVSALQGRLPGWQTYLLWAGAILWVLAMLVGSSLVLQRAVRNDHDIEKLQRQQAVFESEFCEFCYPNLQPALNVKTLGRYEVPAGTQQFPTGYQYPGFRCAVNSSVTLDIGDITTGIFNLDGARLRPQAFVGSQVPFVAFFENTFSNATTTPVTRCVANSTFPFGFGVQFYLVQTSIGPFPCECDTSTGSELCYSYPQDMGPTNPMIDNTNSGIIP